MEHCSVGFSDRGTPHRLVARVQWTVCSRRYSDWGEYTSFLFYVCLHIFVVSLQQCTHWMSFNLLPVCSLAVQINHCPGSGCGLCRRSAGGPCPAVPAWQGNPEAAFLNLVPKATIALINQTVKGEQTLQKEDNWRCRDTYKTAERVVVCSTVHVPPSSCFTPPDPFWFLYLLQLFVLIFFFFITYQFSLPVCVSLPAPPCCSMVETAVLSGVQERGPVETLSYWHTRSILQENFKVLWSLFLKLSLLIL